MRFLVFSDVHANLTALAASLDACDGRWERAVCLGDLVGYGPDPNQVIDRVRELGGAIIRGNHDKSAGAEDGMDDFNPSARKAMEWTRDHLRPDNLRFLRHLPAGPIEAGGLTLVHGALHDEDEYVFSPVQALASLADRSQRGHLLWPHPFSGRIFLS